MAHTLLLFPTAYERDACLAAAPGVVAAAEPDEARLRIELCGFGQLSAAARSAALIREPRGGQRPQRVVVAGIAGALTGALAEESAEALALETCAWFDAVALDGIGAGEGPGRVGPLAMGLPQWPGADADLQGPRIDERLTLWRPEGAPARSELLSVCAAAASPEQAAERRARWPRAAAEEMEAFGAALACAQADVPCGCVRAVSNRAGVRSKEHWRIDGALSALAAELERWIGAATR